MRSTILITLLFALLIESKANTIEYLTFADNLTHGQLFKNPNDSSKRRVSSKRHGTISSEIEWPEGRTADWKNKIQTSIDLAKENWENHLNGDSISLKIAFSDDIEHDIETSVAYIKLQNSSYPLCLHRKKRQVLRQLMMVLF